MKMFKFDLQLFGGGGKGGSSVSSSYSMSPQERQIANYMVENAGKAQSGIGTVLNQYNEAVNSADFYNQLANARNYVAQGQNAISQSANGQLNPEYQKNMAESIRTGVQSTVGDMINNLANRGVVNSSVSNKGLNDIESNVADAMAKAYTQNLGQQAHLGSGLISTANAGYSPYQTLGQLAGSMNNSFVNNAASALNGKGTTTKSEGGAGWGELLGSGLLGLGTGWIGKQIGL